jgi:DNA polymerase-1
MKLVIDLETNSLSNPSHIWCAVCRDITTGDTHIFRKVTEDETVRNQLLDLLSKSSCIIGHNLLGYDLPVLNSLVGYEYRDTSKFIDTLIISKLVDYSRQGHSVEDYGLEFGLEKGKFSDFSKYSTEMEAYCIRDVDITERIYRKYLRYINSPERAPSIRLEHDFQLVCNKLEKDGFAFNTVKASALLVKVESELQSLDQAILLSFPPKEVLIREFTPKATKFGTISKTSVPRSLWDNVSEYQVGKTYRHTRFEEFNPSSHKQIVSVLSEAGWRPVDKTKTHIDTERELNKLKHTRGRSKELDLRKEVLHNKLNDLKVSGWKVNETNLDTLPSKAPASARTIAKRILLESRRRTLTEWLSLVDTSTSRIHGRFYGLGAWTHRMAHQNPNTANIPNETDQKGQKKLYGKELRALWVAPKNRLLVGCDAEGIQLRIFAHYIDDKEFTHELLNGDPHSLNQSILGAKTRDAAKRYIYALLLGAGMGKLREILDCEEGVAKQAYERLLKRYEGFAHLKETIIPLDAKRGWFVGLDGRAVRIPGDTVGARKHLAMSGYLQNGEAVVMKMATLKWWPRLPEMDACLVDMVHDEWQTECPNNLEIALRIANMQADSLREVGEELKLRCPLAGSYWSKKYKDYTIDTNWSKTH